MRRRLLRLDGTADECAIISGLISGDGQIMKYLFLGSPSLSLSLFGLPPPSMATLKQSSTCGPDTFKPAHSYQSGAKWRAVSWRKLDNIHKTASRHFICLVSGTQIHTSATHTGRRLLVDMERDTGSGRVGG